MKQHCVSPMQCSPSDHLPIGYDICIKRERLTFAYDRWIRSTLVFLATRQVESSLMNLPWWKCHVSPLPPSPPTPRPLGHLPPPAVPRAGSSLGAKCAKKEIDVGLANANLRCTSFPPIDWQSYFVTKWEDVDSRHLESGIDWMILDWSAVQLLISKQQVCMFRFERLHSEWH